MQICQLHRRFLGVVLLIVFGLCIAGEARCEAPAGQHVMTAAHVQTTSQQARPVSAFRAHLSNAWSLAVRFLVWAHMFTPLGMALTLFGLLVLVYVVRELFRDVLIFEPLTVPSRFEEAGLTSRVMANRIGAALEELEISIKSVVMKKDVLGYLHSEATPEIEIPGTKIGLKTIVEIFRSLLRMHPKHISGDIVFPVLPAATLPGWRPSSEPSPLTVTIYLTRGRSEIQRRNAVIKDGDLTVLVKRASEIALELANPYLFAMLLRDGREYPRAIEVARKITESPIGGMFRRKEDLRLRKLGFYMWGLVLNDQEKYSEAAEKFEQTVMIDGNFAYGYGNWGISLDYQTEYEKALEKYQKAIALDPKFVFAYGNWGSALQKLKRYEEAAEKYQKAIELDPKFFFAYLSWGNMLHETNQYEEAAVKYQAAIETDANSYEAHYNLGNSLLEQKRYEEAIAKYKKAIELNPKSNEAYYNWGVALLRSGKNVEAQEMFAKAKELEGA
jgi:tetratricopeptide (TPR) repeat protein